VKLIFGIMCLIFIPLSTYAENNQTLVIGFDMGLYNFADSDLDEIKNLAYGSEFIEWYLFDEVGIGIRTYKFVQSDTSDVDEEFQLVILQFTVNWVFLGSNDNLRMALFAGYGPGTLDYSNEQMELHVSENADTASAGVFVDWGSDLLGLRLGFYSVSAKFKFDESNESGTINGSGNSFNLGIRLAF
jgi:hypothetical protein